jgi:hypothetical protein
VNVKGSLHEEAGEDMDNEEEGKDRLLLYVTCPRLSCGEYLVLGDRI